MRLKPLLQKMLLQFVYIVAGSYFATVVFCTVFAPERPLTVVFLWQMLFFCFLADLPGLVYLTRDTLSRRQNTLRTVLHTVLLLAVLMAAGHVLGMYVGVAEGVFFAFVILCVDGFVRLMTYSRDKRLANEINRSLLERKRK